MKQSVMLMTISMAMLISSAWLVAPSHGQKTSPAKSPAIPPAPANNSDCSTIIFNMADCLSFISVGANDTMPTKTCCDGMNSVLQYNPACLCVGLDSGREMGVQINDTRAVSMPSLCKVTITPPNCGIAKGHSPTPSPSPSKPSPSPKTSPTPKASPVAPTPSTSSPPSANAPEISAPAPESDTPTPEAPKASGAGTLSVSVLFLIAMAFSSFA